MRLKETKEVVEMIKRIEAGGGGGGGSDYPFPQGPKTKAYLEVGQVVEVDFAKLKTILEAKEVDLTGYMTGTSICGAGTGTIVFGTGIPSGAVANLLAGYDSDNQTYFLSMNIGPNYEDGPDVAEQLTIADALTAMGKITANILTVDEESAPLVDFGKVIVYDINETEQIVELTEEEAGSYIKFTTAE